MSASVTSHKLWHAPTVERVAAALTAAAASLFTEYRLDSHFRLVTREPGSERHDLPIWAPSPNVVPFSTAWGPVERTDVPGVPGAFVLSNVLTDDEADSIAALSEAMGYTEDAPVSLGRRIRHNENCVIIADSTLWQPIWSRVRQHMPPTVEHPAGTCRSPVGLNQRWRLYKYASDDIFRMHTDGSWPGSGLDAKGSLVRDIYVRPHSESSSGQHACSHRPAFVCPTCRRGTAGHSSHSSSTSTAGTRAARRASSCRPSLIRAVASSYRSLCLRVACCASSMARCVAGPTRVRPDTLTLMTEDQILAMARSTSIHSCTKGRS